MCSFIDSHRFSQLRIRGAAGLLVAGAILAACATTTLGATDANLETARQRSAPGAEVFGKNCAGCHGARGEGLAGTPALMGPNALPPHPRVPSAADQGLHQARPAGPDRDQRGTFHSAADLHRYTVTHMPKVWKRPVALSAEQYWAVVSYVLLAHGVELPDDGVNEGNAANVLLRSAP